MAYRLKTHESIPQNVRRIVREELTSAVSALSNAAPRARDEAIHEARKSIKKIRGVLRLMRPELGADYRIAIDKIRPVATALSELRDSGAIIGTFDALVEPAGPARFSALRSQLISSKRQKERTLKVAGVLRSGAAQLSDFEPTLDSWKLCADGFDALRPGLRRSYRAAKHAFHQAVKDGTAEACHNWRKRVKDHWYHTRLLQPVWDAPLQLRERQLNELETALGEDHNLSVLSALLTSILPDHPTMPGFAVLVEQRSRELRQQAFHCGNELFAQRPRAFLKHLQAQWAAHRTRNRKGAKPQPNRVHNAA